MTALAFTAAAVNAQLVSSDFASGDDGWRGIDVQGPPYDVVTRGPYDLVYQATGGDPGGRVGTTDTAATLFCFSAPSKFLGNRLGFYNGTLHHELRFQNDGLAPGFVHPDVILIGGGLTLVADAGPDPASQTDTWIPFGVALNETNWHLNDLSGLSPTAKQFQNTLSNVTALYIRGDFFSGLDTAWLDNVVMQSSLPALQIAGTNNGVILQWPASAAAFTLETSLNVADTNGWTMVTNAPTLAGTNLQVTLAPLSERAFFRLRWPQP
jgi:hypothetical protein